MLDFAHKDNYKKYGKFIGNHIIVMIRGRKFRKEIMGKQNNDGIFTHRGFMV